MTSSVYAPILPDLGAANWSGFLPSGKAIKCGTLAAARRKINNGSAQIHADCASEQMLHEGIEPVQVRDARESR